MEKIKYLIAIAIIGVLIISSMPSIMAVTGPEVEPNTVNPWFPGGGANAEAQQAGYTYGFKINGYTSGTYTFTDGSTEYSITITSYEIEGNWYFDWVSTFDICAVIVKGGTAANIYDYCAEGTAQTEDDGLHAPDNPNSGRFYGISHITFCWDELVIPPQEDAVISGMKFYDANVDGEYNFGDVILEGWQVTLYIWDENIPDWAEVETTVTDEFGMYYFYVNQNGLYLIVEDLPTGWVQTAPPSPGTWEINVDISQSASYSDNDFGNVYLMDGTGGYTMGFWTNKNGQAKIGQYPDSIDVVDALCGVEVSSAEDIKNYLTKNAKAKEMSVMLTAQLIATVLSVETGSLDGNAIVYLAEVQGYTIDYAPAFLTVNDIIDDANQALCTPADRTEQTFWKNVCDGLNNNWLQFVSPTPP